MMSANETVRVRILYELYAFIFTVSVLNVLSQTARDAAWWSIAFSCATAALAATMVGMLGGRLRTGAR